MFVFATSSSLVSNNNHLIIFTLFSLSVVWLAPKVTFCMNYWKKLLFREKPIAHWSALILQSIHEASTVQFFLNVLEMCWFSCMFTCRLLFGMLLNRIAVYWYVLIFSLLIRLHLHRQSYRWQLGVSTRPWSFKVASTLKPALVQHFTCLSLKDWTLQNLSNPNLRL